MKPWAEYTIKELVTAYGDLSYAMSDYEHADRIYSRQYKTLREKAKAIEDEADRRDKERGEK